MVDSKSTELKENDDFKSDFESKKSKLDSKDEASLSFYECPTAAASIQAFTEENRYITTSLDSEQDFAYYEGVAKTELTQLSINTDNNFSDLGPTSSDGGSVSTSQLTKAKGGYFAGYQAVLFEGNPTLKNRPENFFDQNCLKLAENDLSYVKASKPDFNYIQMNTNFSGAHAPGAPNGEHRPQNNTLAFPHSYGFAPSPAYQPSFAPQPNAAESSIPFTVTSVRSECSNVNDFARTARNAAPSTSFGQAALVASIPEACQSESSSVSGKASTLSYVPEGFETVAVPKYRPVELVERTVEVPVVHHIDTFVPKKEIQEIDTYVKKPVTKYVDKLVEVPQVHYTDKIVEVPEYHEVTKAVPKVEVQERTSFVPKVEVKVVPKYVEVPVVKIVDKYEEYEQVEEVVKHVEKVEVVEVPKEVVRTVVKPVRKVVEREKVVPVYEHRDVPVERVKYVPKVETVEHLRELPRVVDVPVPYSVPRHQFVDRPVLVPRFRDVPVAVPVAKSVRPVFEDAGPVGYVDVPVHKPYFVIHDHLNFKPVGSFGGVSSPFQAQVSGGQVAGANFGANNTATNPNFANPQPATNPNFANNTAATGTNFNGFSQTGTAPGQPNNNLGPSGFAGANNFSLGAQFGHLEHGGYRVVGVNRLDLDSMAPEERLRAQQRLDAALENPDFELYRRSREPGFTVNGAGFSDSVNGAGFSNSVNGAGFSNSVNGAGFSNVGKNGATAGFGRPAPNFGFGPAGHADPYPDPHAAFQGSANTNVNTSYKYEPSYASSFLGWTDRLLRFFAGPKTPPAGSAQPFPSAAPAPAHNAQPEAPKNFVTRPGYGPQDSLRSLRVPNAHLDLERNTPTNRLFFQETENPYAGSGQYYVSSGSGSVGHRASREPGRPPVYPSSGANTPSVH